MSQQLRIIAGVALLVVATGFASAGVFNAMQPPLPQADGVTVGGQSLLQWGNWLIAALGGGAGIWQLVSGLLSKVSPNLADLVRNPIANQFVQQLPALLSIISAGKSAKGKLVFTETVNDVPVTVTIDVGTAPPAA